MDQKKAMLQALIANMRKKMLDGEGDEPMEPGEAVEEASEGKEDLAEILQTEEAELAGGKDLDGDGKPGDAELVAAIKKYMSGDNGAAKMKVGPVFGASAASAPKTAPVLPSKKFGKK